MITGDELSARVWYLGCESDEVVPARFRLISQETNGNNRLVLEESNQQAGILRYLTLTHGQHITETCPRVRTGW
ncbi:Uncharacterised protein [Yersinia enterocolitica]|nr:Uncharacterised protein [Yersinia enterocolitica]CQH65646.1 Uncharacterised protein [Yersinia enterocolitica]